MQTVNYKVVTGPESYLAPSAASMGVVLPDKGERATGRQDCA